jgi:hypothetical protein
VWVQLDEYGMVAFVPLDITEEESMEHLLLQVDHVMQYGAWHAGVGGLGVGQRLWLWGPTLAAK